MMAGLMLVAILFSSVLFNQTLQEHRPELEGWWASATMPIRPGLSAIGNAGRGMSGPAWQIGAWAGVLVLTGLVNGLLDPAFGVNRKTLILALSILLSTGILTFLYSGVEARAARRYFGLTASVRLYAPCVVICLASLAISRAIGLAPGVMYGFITSAVVVGAREISLKDQGRVSAWPLIACLVVSTVAWLAIGPVRQANGDGGNFGLSLLESILAIVFIAGIESVFFNMIPLRVMDGGKVFRWHPVIWAGLALIAAFLFWHVLLHQEREGFGNLRRTESMTVLVICLGYAAASVGTWAYFRVRHE